MTELDFDPSIQHLGNLYFLIQDSVGDTEPDEVDITFTLEEESCKAVIDTDMRGLSIEEGEEGPVFVPDSSRMDDIGQGQCTEGNRTCALLRAFDDYHDEQPVHCGCRGEHEHPRWHRIDVENMMNITSSMISDMIDSKVAVDDKYL